MPTPIRRQYLEIKRRYPDAILFFRLGDFYETFDEDAKIASRELDIVLTARPTSKKAKVPMAGVPYHAAEGYIAKLVSRGYKVAICEQVGEEPIKGLVPRQVARVITPGTVIEPGLLEEKRNNYLCALVAEEGRAGLAYVDITTGEFAAAQLEDESLPQAIVREMARLEPAECLLPDSEAEKPLVTRLRQELGSLPLTPYEDWHFEFETAQRTLLEHFGVLSLEGYGCAGLPLAVSAAGAILDYLEETQAAALDELKDLAVYSTTGYMNLDAATRRHLELSRSLATGEVKGSLLGMLDETKTAMGGRLLRRWLNQPHLSVEAIERRLEAVEALFGNGLVRAELTSRLKGMGDLERLVNRVVQRHANPRDLVGIGRALEMIPGLAECQSRLPARPAALAELSLDPCPEVAELIARAIVPDPPADLSTSGIIARGFSEELDRLLSSSREAKEWVAGLERRERERTGIKSLKVGYNKVFGYYIEVTRPHLERVPAEYIRKQTLVGGERFMTPELKEYESLILNAEERVKELELALFREICEQVAAAAPRILGTARAVAELDVYAAFAEVAARHSYIRPQVTTGEALEIRAGRHPVIEQLQGSTPFVPNDALLSPQDGEVLILTGPNMAGKSTYLRQVALIVLMAQIGSFVPAEKAVIGLVDRIFTRIGAQDLIAQGASTFMVEMMETANILHTATGRSLIILDEIGRGTSTYDGLAIARAVVEYIHSHPRLRGAKTLFATHYHELTELERSLPRVRNYNMAVMEEGDRVVFLYKVMPGGADRSYGIHVARLAGVPRTVTGRAEEILKELEAEYRGPSPKFQPAVQLALFAPDDELVKELARLDVLSMSPLEAINKLYELNEKAKESLSQARKPGG